jgi:hypothetical protein
MKRSSVLLWAALGIGATAMAQTAVDLRTQTKNVDFSGAQTTKPAKTGTVLPSVCSTGEVFIKSNAPAGQNLFICVANAWVLQAGAAHAATHATGGSDPLAPSAIGAETQTNRGAANGYAPLDGGSRLPLENLPQDATFNSVTTGDSSHAGEVQLFEKVGEGNEYVSWLAPDAIQQTLRYRLPAAPPVAGQLLQIGGAPDTSGIVPLVFDNHLQQASLGATAWTETYANDSNTGTRANYLARLTGSGKMIRTAGAGRTGIIGICQTGCGSTGSAEIAIHGRAICTFDNSVTEGDYVQADGVAGKCHDAGSTLPLTGGSVIGQVLESGAAGDHEVQLGLEPEVAGVNAVSLQGRAVATTAPNDGQVLQWSSARGDWEPGSTAGGVSSVDAAGGVQTTSGSPITGSGALRGAELVNRQSGTSYSLTDGDRGKLVAMSNSGVVTLTAPQPGSNGQFAAGWYADVQYGGLATATLAAASALIDGQASIQLGPNQGARLVSDGSNYVTVRGGSTGGAVGSSYYQTIRGMSGLGNGDNTAAQTQRAAAQLGAFLSATDDALNASTQINTDFLDMRAYAIQDHFLNNSSTGGSIGELGWTLAVVAGSNTAGKPGSAASSWPWLGGVRLTAGSSSPAAGNGGSLTLAHNTASPNLGELGSNASWGMAIAFRLNSTANVRFRAGSANAGYNLAPASAFGIRYDTSLGYGDTHLSFFVKPASGGEIAIDTGVSDTNPHIVVIRSTAAGVLRFSLDGGAEKTACASGCDVAVTIPPASQDPFFQLVTDAAATKSADLLEFRFQARLSGQNGNRR